MLDLLRNRIRQGTRTTAFPTGPVELPERYRGLPVLSSGQGTLDVGACMFSPEEAEGAVTYTRDYRMAGSTREALITSGDGIELTRALEERTRRLFGRSLRLCSVVAGGCGGCEAELNATGNVVFDLARFGIQFVASPRHADGIVVTGSVNRNMALALEKTIAATPPPRLVIAVGACAIAGGPYAGSIEAGAGVPAGIHVDLYVPGCPPHPLTIVDGLLRLLDRLPDQAR